MPVQVIQTHISYVLLTGQFAYKVKKPVDFGFLDFSTLARRRHFCEEELRLNRRAAPDLYLAVLPVCQAGAAYHLGSQQGPVVEYVLKMRQFPQEGLLLNYFQRGELTEDLIIRLGVAVAQFHAQTHTDDRILSYGTVAQIKVAIDENYAATMPFINGLQTEAHYQETRSFTDRFLAQRSAIFEQRRNDRKIRECHGDLHLRNICIWQDQIYLFDCIEFNEPFRFVDVIYDIAFTVMDLDARARPDLGNAFLNAYLEQTGDWLGMQVLPLYLCRQAYVRAKVMSLMLLDDGLTDDDRQHAEQEAAHYYHLAWCYAQYPTEPPDLTSASAIGPDESATKTIEAGKRNHPSGIDPIHLASLQPGPPQNIGQLIMMAGLSGSGKSTVARIIARRLNAVHLRSDAIRKHLAGIAVTDRGSDELYTPEMSVKTYDRLQDLGFTLVQQGFSVILDAKYDRHERRLSVLAKAQQMGIPFRILHCQANTSTLKTRLQQRQNDVSDATVNVLASQTFDPFDPNEQPYVLNLDTTSAIEPQLPACHFSNVE